MTTAIQRAESFRRTYTLTLGVTAVACGLLALRAENPSRALAVFGATAGASVVFAAAAWPATKQVVADVAAEKIAGEVGALGQSIFKKDKSDK